MMNAVSVCLCVGLLMASCKPVLCGHVVTDTSHVDVEEDVTIVLPCPIASANFRFRSWYHGHVSDLSQSELVSQTPSGVTGSGSGVSVDSKTFDLSLGVAGLGDDGSKYTCTQTGQGTEGVSYHHVLLSVYVQPKLEFTVPEGPFRPNTTVDLRCRVPRVYPALPPGRFILEAAGRLVHKAIIPMSPSNGSGRGYLAIGHYTLRAEDAGRELACKVVPDKGRSQRRALLIRILRPPEGVPVLLVSPPGVNPGNQDVVTLVCNTSSVTPGYPNDAHIIIWYRDAQTIATSHVESLSVNMTSLTLYMTLEKGGEYRCSVGNSVGDSDQSEPELILRNSAESQFRTSLSLMTWVATLLMVT